LMFGTSVQIEPAPAAIQFGPANEREPTGITSTTASVAGSILATDVVGWPSQAPQTGRLTHSQFRNDA
jgi:hypothetical protein